LLIVGALFSVCLVPRVASADATLFVGRNSAGDNRTTVRGFAVGVSLVIVGFEFEYANTGEDQTLLVPSLRTTSGNVSVQNPGGFQFYATTGGGIYREKLGADEETAFAFNTGGGIKANIAGPIRVRVDYRIFRLQGHPQHKTIQRIYAGLNLKF
jgi:opacity protein-like surface antigen